MYNSTADPLGRLLMAVSAPAQAVKPPKWYNWIRKLDSHIPEKSNWRKIGRVSKWVVPISTAIAFTIAFLATPGFVSIAGLLFWLAIGPGSSTAVSVGLSKGFKHAAALRKISELEASGLSEDLGLKVELADANKKLKELQDGIAGLRTANDELRRAAEELESTKGTGGREILFFDGQMLFIKELGRGGMAAAFLAFDFKLGRVRVCKVPIPDVVNDKKNSKLYFERFRNEARVMAALENEPNVVRIYSVGELNPQGYRELFGTRVNVSVPYIVMEYIDPPIKLETRLRRERATYSWEQATRWVIDIAKALAAAEKLGVIHRDVKPDNIWLVKGKEGENVKLGDFGLGKLMKSSTKLTQQGVGMGTPEYMPPEQWSDAETADRRADQHALGAVYHELLVGEPPHGYMKDTSEYWDYRKKVENDPIPDIQEKIKVPYALVVVLYTMLAKGADQRYQSWDACVEALESISAAPAASPSSVIGNEETVARAQIVDGKVIRDLRPPKKS